MFTSIVAAIVVLGFLITFHEMGHFLIAKRMGVGVLKFSIGFGPTIFGRKIGDTEYVVSAIPLGGFVKMVGEDPEEELSPSDQAISFNHKPVGKRTAIVLAGPLANLLFSFIAFSLVYSLYGSRVPTEAAKVGGTIEGMPAAQAGLQAGDVVTTVNGTPVSKWESLSDMIRASKGETLHLRVQRNESAVDVDVTPMSKPDKNMFGEVIGDAFVIGIERGYDQEFVNPLEATWMGLQQTGWWIKTLVISLVKMFQGRIPAKDIGGPILIVQTAGQQARMGLEYLLNFMAVISINLGVLNLLPIPILDGGHLFFFAIEAILRRPLDIRHREIAQQIGLVLLVGLMAFAFYNDIARVIHGWG